MSYELATKDYPVVDMFKMDGLHFSQHIEADLRQIAIAEGYPVSTEPGAEDEVDWEDRVSCRIDTVEAADGTKVYRGTLNSYSEMTKAG